MLNSLNPENRTVGDAIVVRALAGDLRTVLEDSNVNGLTPNDKLLVLFTDLGGYFFEKFEDVLDETDSPDLAALIDSKLHLMVNDLTFEHEEGYGIKTSNIVSFVVNNNKYQYELKQQTFELYENENIVTSKDIAELFVEACVICITVLVETLNALKRSVQENKKAAKSMENAKDSNNGVLDKMLAFINDETPLAKKVKEEAEKASSDIEEDINEVFGDREDFMDRVVGAVCAYHGILGFDSVSMEKKSGIHDDTLTVTLTIKLEGLALSEAAQKDLDELMESRRAEDDEDDEDGDDPCCGDCCKCGDCSSDPEEDDDEEPSEGFITSDDLDERLVDLEDCPEAIHDLHTYCCSLEEEMEEYQKENRGRIDELEQQVETLQRAVLKMLSQRRGGKK